MKHGKKYVDAAKLVDRTKLYDTNEALDTVIKTAVAKFDETVELHVKLGVDSRHADQQVRGAVVLPNGTVYLTSFSRSSFLSFVSSSVLIPS